MPTPFFILWEYFLHFLFCTFSYLLKPKELKGVLNMSIGLLSLAVGAFLAVVTCLSVPLESAGKSIDIKPKTSVFASMPKEL